MLIWILNCSLDRSESSLEMEKGVVVVAAEAVDVKLEYHKDDGVEEEEERVCSLCGDIGFKNSLLLCKKCGFRFQHSYCSRLYPDIDMEKWSCEWCLHEQQHHHHKQMDAVVMVAAATAATAVDDYEFGRKNKRNKKRKRQRSSSKVFEFLLDIADQSSPEAEKHTKQQLQKTSTVCGRNDDKRSIISSSLSDEKAMKRSSSSSSSFGNNKRKFVDIGLESPTSTAATTTTSSTSTREKSSASVAAAATATEMLKRDNHHQELSNGRFHKTAVTKNKSNNNNNSKVALDRWRNLAANKNKLGCRRYKLLADVH